MTTLNQPFADLARFQQDVDRMLADAFGTRRGPEAAWKPRLDLTENADAYVLALDLPGVAKEDVEITFEEETLRVRGERKRAEAAEGVTMHRRERTAGTFERVLSFRQPVDADAITAAFEHGVLTVTVPKAEAAKPRQIRID